MTAAPASFLLRLSGRYLALARFYTDHLDLITAAVVQHRDAHRAGQHRRARVNLLSRSFPYTL